MKTIDLRSDTVTQPTAGMLEAMLSADVGDDVYREDETVNSLEDKVASMTAKEAAVFLPTGTQSNLVALLSHCQRGEEYIVGQQAHTFKYEGGGAAVLGSIQPQPIEFEEDATLDLVRVSKAIKPDDSHFAKTRLLCLENTHFGKVLPMSYLVNVREFCAEKNLKLHLDGARIFNAAISLNVTVDKITKNFDSVSICLSKGLGAPVGSVLSGSKDFIEEARRWRKVVGGGMRQGGYMAACGIYALDNQVDRLQLDHANAERLAQGLTSIKQVTVQKNRAFSNMVFLKISGPELVKLTQYLAKRSIKVGGYGEMRLVTHLDVESIDIDRVVAAFRDYYR